MTSAPSGLLDSRTLLLDHLDGLSGAEVGIVGDPAHRGGYHCGRDRIVANDYSNRHARDRAGLSDYASALDVGEFRHLVRGKAHDLRTFSAWLVAQCRANTADSRDIREVIYSTDGQTVKRWDRLSTSGTGDSSHRWHTHISVFRDATKAGRGLAPLFTRYLTEIGILADPTPLTPEVAPMTFRIQVRNTAAVVLSNGGSVPNGTVNAELNAKGVPLVLVDTEAQRDALMSPTALQLAAAEAREVARDAGQTALIQQVLAAAGNPLSSEQFEQMLATVRTAAEQAGEAATEALKDRLHTAAQAEADALADEPTP